MILSVVTHYPTKVRFYCAAVWNALLISMLFDCLYIFTSSWLAMLYLPGDPLLNNVLFVNSVIRRTK